MEFHADKAFFKSDTVDPFTNLPIYVFDSNFLPNFTQTNFDRKTVDSLLVKAFKKIIRRIPQEAYALVCFTSGFKNFNNTNNTWVTALKCFQLLPEDLKSNMQKAYMVHESWLVRSFSSLVTNVLHIKLFKNNPQAPQQPNDQRLVYCRDLTELSKFVDITKLRIGLDVYLYDLQFTEKLIIPYTVKPKSGDYQDYIDLINERMNSRLLTEGPKHELVFTKPGNQKKLWILLDAIERGNYLDMSQWDIYVMGSLYLHFLRKNPEPLIPIDLIELPIKDDFDYTLEMFSKIVRQHDNLDKLSKIFEILINMLEHETDTRHSSKSLSKALTPALCQEKVSIKTNDRLLVGQRYIKNLIEHWDGIMRAMTVGLEPQRDTIRHRRRPPVPPEPRKVSFGGAMTTSSKPKKKVQMNLPKKSDFATDITDMEQLPPPPPVATKKASILSLGSVSSTDSNDSLLDGLKMVRKSDSMDSLVEEMDGVSVDDKEKSGARILSDVSSKLNKQKQESPTSTSVRKQKQNSVLLKFADGYSSIEGQKKVTKLAKLYEERLMGIQLINEIENKKQ